MKDIYNLLVNSEILLLKYKPISDSGFFEINEIAKTYDILDNINKNTEKIQDLKQQLNNAEQNLVQNQEQLQNDAPDPSATNKLTEKLALGSSLVTLAGIGTGLFLGIPLLLGGSRSNKQKYKRKNKKTIKNIALI